MELLYWAVVSHFIGDYVLQSEFLATTKGKSMYHLLVHSVLYSVPFAFLVFDIGWKILALIIVHFIVDALKAKYSVIRYFTDQVLHFITILVLCLL